MPRILQPTALKQGLGAFVAGLVMVAAAIAGWCYWQHHFWTALKGPTPIKLEQLAKIEHPGQLPSTWVVVQFDKAVKTDVAIEEVQIGENRVEEEYWLFQAGERWMIGIVKPGFQGNVLAGQIYHNHHQLNNEAFVAVYQNYQDVHHGKLFPFELHAEVDYDSNWKAFAGLMGALAALGVFVGVLGCVITGQAFRPPLPGEAEAELDFSALESQTAVQAEDTIARFMREAAQRDR
jgi:hypothetical protein